jgi:hypothetical protein
MKLGSDITGRYSINTNSLQFKSVRQSTAMRGKPMLECELCRGSSFPCFGRPLKQQLKSKPYLGLRVRARLPSSANLGSNREITFPE